MVDLARYATKAMEGQNFTASGEHQFDGYRIAIKQPDANIKSGYVDSSLYCWDEIYGCEPLWY